MVRFCTAINCMDGRAQLPVISYLKERFNADHVDMVTEAGVNRVLALAQDTSTIESIQRRVRISVQRHQSVGVAVAGHHDCAGNPVSDVQQNAETLAAVHSVHKLFPDIPIIGLWLNECWNVEELPEATANNDLDLTADSRAERGHEAGQV